MAKMMGARVLGLVSSEDKAAVALAHGCDQTLIYRSPDGGETVNFSGAAKTFSRAHSARNVVYSLCLPACLPVCLLHLCSPEQVPDKASMWSTILWAKQRRPFR